MAIAADGTWFHEGVPIKRAELWQLFAGILRREDDGEYYLVTPVEKCRVSVALHPLIITDIVLARVGQGPGSAATLNAGGRLPVSLDYPLNPEESLWRRLHRASTRSLCPLLQSRLVSTRRYGRRSAQRAESWRAVFSSVAGRHMLG